MNQAALNRLEHHRADFEAITKKPFQHFHCPILGVDEDVQLMRGHVINEAFKGSSKKWVIQRKDVDGFYGAFFEGDFELMQYADGASQEEFFRNKKLWSAFRPRIYFKGRKVEFHLGSRNPPPEGFQFVVLGEDENPIFLYVKATLDQMLNDPKDWQIETSFDLRLPAFVSLVKSAHLTMFSMFGYRHVFSIPGQVVGGDILGGFYRANQHIKTKPEAQRKALDFFRPYRHMVRPIKESASPLEGTVSDGVLHLCVTPRGMPWAMIVYIRTGTLHHAVMMPPEKGGDAFATYQDFLKNDNETIHVQRGVLKADHWSFDPNAIRYYWPKDGAAFPSSIR